MKKVRTPDRFERMVEKAQDDFEARYLGKDQIIAKWESCDLVTAVTFYQEQLKKLKEELAEVSKHASKPTYICVGCGHTSGFTTVAYDTPGEPVDYDMECTNCGSREIDEGIASRLVERCERAEAELAQCQRERDNWAIKLQQATQREARLREALQDIISMCEDEDWEYMFGDLMDKAKHALEEAGR